MYVPRRFEEKDKGKIHAFICGNSFAILVSIHEGRPIGTHIPLRLETNAEGQDILVGHISKGNEQKHKQRPAPDAAQRRPATRDRCPSYNHDRDSQQQVFVALIQRISARVRGDQAAGQAGQRQGLARHLHQVQVGRGGTEEAG